MEEQQIGQDAFIKLRIVEAKWLKDADFFGKQDPFVKWSHFGNEMRTTTKDEAGKHAIFNEDFILTNINGAVQSGIPLKLDTFDEDAPGKFDYIGGT